jgi:hypothetical protein
VELLFGLSFASAFFEPAPEVGPDRAELGAGQGLLGRVLHRDLVAFELGRVACAPVLADELAMEALTVTALSRGEPARHAYLTLGIERVTPGRSALRW